MFQALTFRRSLSNASFKLNILRRSRMLAALRWAIDATRRLVFLVGTLAFPLLLVAVNAPRGDKRCETNPPIWDRGQRATDQSIAFI